MNLVVTFIFLILQIKAVSYGIVQRNFEPALDSQGSHQYATHNSQKEHVPGARLVMKATPILPDYDSIAQVNFEDDYYVGGPLDY